MTKIEQVNLVHKAFIKILEPLERNKKQIGAYILKQDRRTIEALKKVEILCKLIEQAMGVGNLKQALRYLMVLEKETGKLYMNIGIKG